MGPQKSWTQLSNHRQQQCASLAHSNHRTESADLSFCLCFCTFILLDNYGKLPTSCSSSSLSFCVFCSLGLCYFVYSAPLPFLISSFPHTCDSYVVLYFRFKLTSFVLFIVLPLLMYHIYHICYSITFFP